MLRDNENIFDSLDIKDSDEAFDNAIRKGMKNPYEYMYMYSKHGYDFFKHINTRHYKSFKRKDAGLFYKIKNIICKFF